jgi:Asp-tRNA(Asn)/Glu-tRNA(Gln) amidotransferase A subunit family amidase
MSGAPPRLLDIALTSPPVKPAIAFVRTPVWDEAEAATQDGFAELVEVLGEACAEVALPDSFGEWRAAHRALMTAGMARNLGSYYRRARDRLAPGLREMIEAGTAVTAVDYFQALDWRKALTGGLDKLFDRYDAIITPAAPGEAPKSLETTGNPVFSGLWTLCGVPAVTLPLLQGPDGMPVGVQMVGRRGEDARLLRTARWLVEMLQEEGQDASVVVGARQ